MCLYLDCHLRGPYVDGVAPNKTLTNEKLINVTGSSGIKAVTGEILLNLMYGLA